MTESPLDWAESTEDEPTDRRRQLMILGGVAGVAVLAGGAFLLLHGGGSSSNDTGGLVAGAHHPAQPPASAPAPSAQPVVTTFHGSVGHDPFEVPDRIAAALAPAPVAAPATSVAGPQSSGIGSITIPTGTTPGSVTTPVTSVVTRTPTQWIQLLASHKQANGSYTVDVRTPSGTVKGVKPGTKKIGGTYFSYVGDDSELGVHSYVFIVGDSAGGNLVPNTKVPTYRGALNLSNRASTLVLRNGMVDGGLYL